LSDAAYHGLDIDEQILAHLATPGGARIAKQLDPEAIEDDETFAALDAWLRYDEEYGKPIPPEILADEIGREDEFPEAVGEPEKWLDMHRLRQLQEDGIVALRKAGALGKTNPVAAFEYVVSEGSRLLSRAAPGASNESFGTEGAVDWYLNRASSDMTGLTFGWPELDTHLGGLRLGELYVLVARLKRYKSWLLQKSFVETSRNGIPVTFANLEMPENEFKLRLGCMLGGVSWAKAAKTILGPEETERLREVEAYLRDAEQVPHPPHIIKPPVGQRTVPNLVRAARAKGSQALYIDQYSYLEATNPELNRSENDWLKYAAIAQELKDATDQIPIFVAAQLNRPGSLVKRFEEIEARHISRSDYLGQVADLVLGSFASHKMKSIAGVLHYGIVESRSFPQRAWEIKIDLDDRADFRYSHEHELDQDDD
jgi:hypothetical protein